ncbi:MAG: CotH kinase family protein [Desulfuromonadales bacterium]|nr:CotH kinase family protein [Desulfuromonadales bacterium]
MKTALREMKVASSHNARNDVEQDEHVEEFNLFVPESGLAKLNENLPDSGREYVKGRILDGSSLKKMKLKYRGDYSYHWANHKKSMRVKTSKSSLYNGMRSINLIAPKQTNTILGLKFAEYFDLLVPRSGLAQVYINGESHGLYVYVEQIGELMLRDAEKMPGDIYSGDLTQNDKFRGINDRIFSHPGVWEKRAINNHYPPEAIEPLKKLIQLIQDPYNLDNQKQLSRIMDMDAWGRFGAYTVLCQTHHYTMSHNWNLYFDPMKGKFFPVVWDPVAWFDTPPPDQPKYLDTYGTELHIALFFNGDYLKARYRAIEDFFGSGKDKKFIDYAESVVSSIKRMKQKDPLVYMNYATLSGARTTLPGIVGTIKDAFSSLKKTYVSEEIDAVYEKLKSDGAYAISFSGRKPIRKLRFVYPEKIKSLRGATLKYNVRGKEVELDVSDYVRLRGNRMELDLELIYNQKPIAQHKIDIVPAYYVVAFDCDLGDMAPVEVLAATDEVNYTRIEPGRTSPAFFLHENPFVTKPIAQKSKIWRSEIVINEVVEVDENVIIEPGAKIYLAPGAGIIFRGRVFAKGASDAPIQFLPLPGQEEPWGSIVVRGDSAKNSRFEHCQFTGGSGLKEALFEYSAMFSIHDASGIVINNCRFSNSKLVDDMVHAVYSDVSFNHCEFSQSLSDALDIDISTATLNNCRFNNSGNDALDLMDSQVVVLNSVMQNSGDKGMSVGEGSRLLAINNRLSGNAIGVQVKDGAAAALYNLDFIGNKLALDAYKKNWRYGNGGKVVVDKSHFLANAQGVTADKNSSIHIFDSYFAPLPELNKKQRKRVVLGEWVDNLNQRTALSAHIAPFEGLFADNATFSNDVDRVIASQRGASLGQY